MFGAILSAAQDEFSGQAAKDQVAIISQHHRIQASPGYRAAARHCVRYLQKLGVAVEIHSYPATDDTRYWTESMFREWDASEACLHLIGENGIEEKLADYREIKMSLIQRSTSFDGEAEVVVLDKGETDSDYEGRDVAGRIVLTNGDIRRVYQLAVVKRGALGILFDGMRSVPPIREAMDLPDTRQYTSFWWSRDDVPCFGFVLTPRQGQRLRSMAGKTGEPAPRVRAHVAAWLYDGSIEVVSALIPGRTKEEVVLTAHLCHPQPSCNDNASGAAAALEVAHTLHSLIRRGVLSQPRRGIRFLWVPEMTGTYAYLATHEDDIPGMIAGLNLDMVGESQDSCGSSFLIEQPPASMASFVSTLAERIREDLPHGSRSHSGVGGYPLYRHAVTPFSGGSDHYILSDPSVGVPTPMLIQWPDKYYHTSDDTLDKVDPVMLAVVGAMSSTYLYFLANAEADEAIWLGHEITTDYKGRLARALQKIATEAFVPGKGHDLASLSERIRGRAAFMLRRSQEAVGSLTRLSSDVGDLVHDLREETEGYTAEQLRRVLDVVAKRGTRIGSEEVKDAEPSEEDEWKERARQVVPKRVFRGPISMRAVTVRMTQEERDAWHAFTQEHREASRTLPTVALYWADGRRSLMEIAGLVEMEIGECDLELLVRYFELLARHEFVTLQARE